MNLLVNTAEISSKKNRNIMNTIFKLILVFSMFIFSSKGYSQNADPGIGIIINPISVTQGGTGILSANVGNYGNSTIVANSLMVSISVGPNSQILGIANGSDYHWTQFSLSNGSGNTMILKNTFGGFDSFDIGDILLSIRGNSVSNLDLITGNIGYVNAENPLLCGICPPVPLNNTQGNASNSNDYSQTSLIITAPTCTTPNLTVFGANCNGTTYDVSFNSNGIVTASSGIIVGNTITGILVGTDVIVTSTTISECASTQTTFQSPTSCITHPIDCSSPTISAGNGVCSGSGLYSVSVSSSIGSQISANVGTVFGNSVIGIPLGIQVTITATSGICSSSVMVSSPLDCTTPCVTSAVSYSVGNCLGATYTIYITNPSSAILQASSGILTATAVINIPIGTNVTLSATSTECTAQVITLSSPVCCDLITPTVGVVTEPTCSVSSGSFTITNYNAAYIYNVTPSLGVIIVGNSVTAPSGNYTITATSGSCTSPVTLPIVINAQPAALITPTVGVVTQPTCSVSSGSFTITNYNAAYIYNVTPPLGVIIVGDSVTAPTGSYTITATSGSCSSPVTLPIVINVQPAVLNTTTVGVVTQPTCSVSSGSFTITNYNASFSYNVTPSLGVIIVGDSVTAPTGSYTITATSGSCTSPVTLPIVINAQPSALITPTLGVVTQPTCSVSSGSFTITNYNAAYSYNVTPSLGVIIFGNSVTAPSGSYTITATSGSCTSPVTLPIVINVFNYSACASIALIKTAQLDDFNHDQLAQVGEHIIYTFVISNTGLVPLTNVIINDPLPGVIMTGGPISLNVGEIDSTSFTGVYTITAQDIINGSLTNQATVYGTPPSGNQVHDLSSSESNTKDDPTVLPIVGCKVEVFNAVTPNNDGSNDFLYISGLDCFTDNSIEIFNRWGVSVYEIQGYDNLVRAFRGYSEGRVTINKSELLPSGTYYYVLKYKDYHGNALSKTGYFYLTL